MYKQRILQFEFFNETQPFDKEGNNRITLSDVKAMFKVGAYGNQAGVQAEMTIYGLSLELLAALSSKGIGIWTAEKERIRVVVHADDTLMFNGYIYSSFANMNAAPDAPLVINAAGGLDLQTESAPPFSRPGPVNLVDVLRAICEPYKYRVNAVGIDGVVINNAHLVGSPLGQVIEVCNLANVSMTVTGDLVTAWPRGKAVDDVVPFISPDHGLIGYPVFTQSGITFQTEFSTLLAQGRFIQLETSLPHASGRYMLYVVEHYLSSWIDGGPWHSICQGAKAIAKEAK